MVKSKCAIYIRVSTSLQEKKGYSLRDQRERLPEICQGKGWQLQEVYDEGQCSGETIIDRLQMQRLLKDAQAGKFDICLVAEFERISRNARDFEYICDVFKKSGIELATPAESLDLNVPGQKLNAGLRALLAEFEKENFRIRSSKGKNRAVKEGKWCGFRISYGHRVNKGTKIIEVNQEEIKNIELIERLVVEEGLSLHKTAEKLNGLGIRTQLGKLWCAPSVRDTLLNPALLGEMYYKGIKLKIPAVTTQKRQAQVREAIKKHRALSKKKMKLRYLLRSLLKCGLCGRRLIGKGYTHHRKWRKSGELYIKERIRPLRYYSCSAKDHKMPGKDRCTLKPIKADEIEEAVWSQVREIIDNPDKLVPLVREYKDELFVNDIALEAHITHLNEQIDQKPAEEQRILGLYRRNKINEQAYDNELINIRLELEQLIEEKEEAGRILYNAQTARERVKSLETYLRQIHNRLNTDIFEERRAIIESLVEAIIVNYDTITGTHTVKILFAIPELDPLKYGASGHRVLA